MADKMKSNYSVTLRNNSELAGKVLSDSDSDDRVESSCFMEEENDGDLNASTDSSMISSTTTKEFGTLSASISTNSGASTQNYELMNEWIHGRKRKLTEGMQMTCRDKRNRGLSYCNRRGKGKIVEEAKPGPECRCRLKCYENTTETDRKMIFEDFWKLGHFNTQNAYLFGCLAVEGTKRKTTKSIYPSRRTHSVNYFVETCAGSKIKVCKMAFLNIHGLQKHRGRVENIVASMRKGNTVPALDKRGTHSNHPKKYSDKDIANVKSFISRLPMHSSHYSQSQNPNRVLKMEYTVESCYERYKEECVEVQTKFVSRDKFRRIFAQEFDITSKNPKLDLCSESDSPQISELEAKNEDNRELVNEFKQKSKIHQKVLTGQDAIKNATELQGTGTYVITFGLQKALPMPKLSTCPTFHKRKVILL